MDCWRLDGGDQTLVLATEGAQLPWISYWGAALPRGESLEDLTRTLCPDVTGGMLDIVPKVSIFSTSQNCYPGQPGISGIWQDGASLYPEFSLTSLCADTGLKAEAVCLSTGLRWVAELSFDPDLHVLCLQSRLEAEDLVRVHRFSAPTLPVPAQCDRMTTYSGRWCGEMQRNTVAFHPGVHLRESRAGRSDHAHYPAVLLETPQTSFTKGEAWAFHYAWSGGHRMIAEELPDGRRTLQFGPAAGSEPAARVIESAPLYAAYSPAGRNGCARAFQRLTRKTLRQPKAPRRVHYNCWEAVYFDHDVNRLCDIATKAADLGAERFVLDDGWFGLRDDDTTSLGDWQIDARKYPDGLGPLVDHVTGLGMRFGIWFEPEMVSPDSDLARAHPDWILGPADQPLGRQQLVLDMARGDVRDYLYDAIAAVLKAYPVDYIKWDHNRVLPVADAAQTRGTYALLDRLGADFPDLEIESCASGGGRLDMGILSRTGRVWLSDSNDALERLRIQADAAQWLPASVTGSHVGPRVCHTSRRELPMDLRAWVAASRQMGFECDPSELTEAEANTLRHVTRWWKDNRDWLMQADILRLDTLDKEMIAEQHISADGARFVVFAGLTASLPQINARPLRFSALDPSARYRITLKNTETLSHLSRSDMPLKSGPVTLSGQALMQAGLALPWQMPQTLWVLEGERL